MSAFRHPLRLLPGLLLSVLVAGLALAAARAEQAWFGEAWLEGLVLAILFGAAIASLARLSPAFRPGIDFCAKAVLEVAIVLLGASISIGTLGEAGLGLVGGIVGVVALSLLAGYAISRALGLSPGLSTLVACGNSICGNSAIAAAAPVIRAEASEVAASLSFTAFLSILVVLLLPVLYVAIGMSPVQSGVFAGLTVYAVPQVLAAAAPAGAIGIQVGTLVKLVRVLMLGPLIFLLGLAHGRKTGAKLTFLQMVPWFIIGFLAMMALRSAELIPAAALAPMHEASGLLTVVAMAALGLTVDIRSVMKSGGRVIVAALLSLTVLGIVSYALIRFLGVA
ncbi:putative sulfate exporter family transporter [Nitratireductor aquibiodomus]|uniref:YeiH family protein n=1 Tax=Nitratireductor aquibiodomus TaxID=204799 RepID=UPI0019D3BA5E|nr:putative sulfate exporter family transporter [Nitratireductor aquibiodomus]MBN7763750.1 putative sulfate exporter family transporter [Nitratireductor aquibiodomus]